MWPTASRYVAESYPEKSWIAYSSGKGLLKSANISSILYLWKKKKKTFPRNQSMAKSKFNYITRSTTHIACITSDYLYQIVIYRLRSLSICLLSCRFSSPFVLPPALPSDTHGYVITARSVVRLARSLYHDKHSRPFIKRQGRILHRKVSRSTSRIEFRGTCAPRPVNSTHTR